MKDSFQLDGSAAQIYEQQKVPAIFGPLADATLRVLDLSEQDSVLDVACGTGIVARKARAMIGPSARVVGADLNEGMIEAARSMTDAHAQSCEWHIADVCDLPFGDDEFSVVLCQQGLQFFPDEEAALIEMKRVLRPQGRIALTIWSGPSALFQALARSIGKHVDEAVAERSLAPFTYAGSDHLESRLSGIGFGDISRQTLAIDRIVVDPETSIPKEIMGNPIGPSVAARGDAIMRKITEEVIDALVEYRRGADLVVPQHTHLFQARFS